MSRVQLVLRWLNTWLKNTVISLSWELIVVLRCVSSDPEYTSVSSLVELITPVLSRPQRLRAVRCFQLLCWNLMCDNSKRWIIYCTWEKNRISLSHNILLARWQKKLPRLATAYSIQRSFTTIIHWFNEWAYENAQALIVYHKVLLEQKNSAVGSSFTCKFCGNKKIKMAELHYAARLLHCFRIASISDVNANRC